MKAEHRKFIREFAVWIYRAIELYWRESRKGGGGSDLILRKFVPVMGRGALRESHTLLDVILALLEFKKENPGFLLTALRERRRGAERVNWAKTTAKCAAVWSQGRPAYAEAVNRRREADFDDELFRVYYSILAHVAREYGFEAGENPGFAELTRVQFGHWLAGYGRVRLREIKGKYFSDLALRLWELCFAFFDHGHEIRVRADRREHLLAKNFQIVFEAIIDELIGEKNPPAGLKEQEDGKRVDHLYRYRSLTLVDGESGGGETYYIGDSKYYKRRTEITKEAVYKQFTYARNVIQWNLDLFLDRKDAEGKGLTGAELAAVEAGGGEIGGLAKLRDEATEGYAPTPNFFISARIDEDLDYNHDEITDAKKKRAGFFSRQFENRLFDRDTLLVAHYDVNFLFAISRYARNNACEKRQWREKVRAEFRRRIREMLEERFEFYAITPKAATDAEAFFRENFKELIGRTYSPYGRRGGYEYYSLALRKGEAFEEENAAVRGLVEQGFKVAKCKLGERPEKAVEGEARAVRARAAAERLTFHWLENYSDETVVFGYCKGEAHLKWMFGREGGKSSDMYNLRANLRRHGGVSEYDPRVIGAKFLVLYFGSTESDNIYRVFRIRKGRRKMRKWMEQTGYPVEPGGGGTKYWCYELEEEVTLGALKVREFLAAKRLERADAYAEGEPVIATGAEVLQWRAET